MTDNILDDDSGAAAAAAVEAVNIVDDDSDASGAADAAELGDCSVVGLLPFTYNGKLPEYFGLERNRTFPAYTHMAAAVMAADHFNSRNPAVVPELADELYQECSVRLPTGDEEGGMRFVDTQTNKYETARLLTDLAAEQGAIAEDESSRKVCALAGPYNDDPSIVAGTFASGLDVPIVAHGPSELSFGRREVHPRAATTSVYLHTISDVSANYLKHRGRSNFLAILAPSKTIGDQMRETLENSAKDLGFTHIMHLNYGPQHEHEGPYVPNKGVGYAMREIKRAGFRNIFVVTSFVPKYLPWIAEYAEKYGLLDGEHVWMMGTEGQSRGKMDLDELVSMASSGEDANLTKLVRGMAAVHILDGFEADPSGDSFLAEWRKNDGAFVDRLNAMHPVREGPGAFQVGQDYFQTASPERGAGFMYDAVMSIGIGRCIQEAIKRGRLKAAEKKGPPSFVAPPNGHYDGITQAKFTGATGPIEYGMDRGFFEGQRKEETPTFGVFNFRDIGPAEKELRPDYNTWYYLTDIHTGMPLYGNWSEAPDAPFIFSSGLPVPPERNNDLPEQNYLSRGVHITGLTFMSVALLLTFASAVLVAVFRKVNPFRPAQPFFLLVLMFGATMMSFAILTMSFDESYGWTDDMLDAACAATPWLVALGYNIIYLALFSKLWRIERVLDVRSRRKVEIKHVVAPLAVAVLATVAVLIGWTVADPLRWVREVIDPNTLESYGECRCGNALAFLVPLIVLAFVSTVACGVMAYRCRDIDSKFSESNYIFYTIFVQIQVLLVGIPVLVILDEGSADAQYLGRTLVIFVVVMTTVGFMIGPKVATLVQNKLDPNGTKRSKGNNRGAIGTGNVRVSGMNPPVVAMSSCGISSTGRSATGGVTSTVSTMQRDLSASTMQGNTSTCHRSVAGGDDVSSSQKTVGFSDEPMPGKAHPSPAKYSFKNLHDGQDETSINIAPM